MKLIVPHPDDELLFASSVLEEVDEVLTLTYYPEELRALEQRKVAEHFSFEQSFLGLHDDWNMAPSDMMMDNLLWAWEADWIETGEVVLVPLVPLNYYGSILHHRLETWARSFRFKIEEKKPHPHCAELFRWIYKSQLEIEGWRQYAEAKDSFIKIMGQKEE